MALQSSVQASTVIEVLIATVVVGLSLTALALLMTNNVRNNAEADYRQAASQIAQNTMEKIRINKETKSWSMFKGGGWSTTDCSNYQTRYSTNFRVECSIQNVVPADDNGRKIVVNVCWPQTTGSCTGTSFNVQVVQDFWNY